MWLWAMSTVYQNIHIISMWNLKNQLLLCVGGAAISETKANVSRKLALTVWWWMTAGGKADYLFGKIYLWTITALKTVKRLLILTLTNTFFKIQLVGV